MDPVATGHDREPAAPEPAPRRLDDARRERRRDGGIDRVAAVADHLGSRLARERVVGGHHAPLALGRRARRSDGGEQERRDDEKRPTTDQRSRVHAHTQAIPIAT